MGILVVQELWPCGLLRQEFQIQQERHSTTDVESMAKNSTPTPTIGVSSAHLLPLPIDFRVGGQSSLPYMRSLGLKTLLTRSEK